MSWKIFGKALAITIGLFIFTIALVLFFIKCPVWITATVGFLAVFWMTYDAMKRHYDLENDKEK